MASAPSSFSAAALEKKLKDLNSSLQSIQGVSQWLIHYRRNAKTIVNVWYKELQKGSCNSQLLHCNTYKDGSFIHCTIPLHHSITPLRYTIAFLVRNLNLFHSQTPTHALIAAVSRKLTLLYLANDIIQNSRKKGQEYHTHFSKIMPRALQQIAK